jgi:hypothetical protein
MDKSDLVVETFTSGTGSTGASSVSFIVERTENYVTVSQEEATTRTQTFSTPNGDYVLLLPANHLQQAPNQSTKYKSLLPVKITDNHVSVTSVPHSDHDYLAPELAPVPSYRFCIFEVFFLRYFYFAEN